MTVTGYGYLGLMGIGEEATYGTEVAAQFRVPFISSTLDDDQALVSDVSLQGRPGMPPPDHGSISAKGNIIAMMRYNNNNLLLKHCLGQHVGGVYDLHTPREGLGLTIPIDKQVSIWTFLGGKVSQWELDSSIARVSQTATMVCQKLVRNTGINNLAHLQSLADPSLNLLHRQLSFQMGPQTGTLSVADAWDISVLKFVMARHVDELFTNSLYMHEPLDNAYPTATLSITLPHYQTDQFKQWEQDGVLLHARAIWSNGTSTFELAMSSLSVSNAPVPTSGPGLLSQVVTLQGADDGDPAHPMVRCTAT